MPLVQRAKDLQGLLRQASLLLWHQSLCQRVLLAILHGTQTTVYEQPCFILGYDFSN